MQTQHDIKVIAACMARDARNGVSAQIGNCSFSPQELRETADVLNAHAELVQAARNVIGQLKTIAIHPSLYEGLARALNRTSPDDRTHQPGSELER